MAVRLEEKEAAPGKQHTVSQPGRVIIDARITTTFSRLHIIGYGTYVWRGFGP